jgi:hypothetical protein
MKKYISIGLILTFFTFTLSGCSSDKYSNAGSCSTPGVSKFINGKLSVCGGLKGNKKWYFEGNTYSDLTVLGKIEYHTCDCTMSDDFYSTAKKLGVWEATFSNFFDISTSEFTKVTGGDPRWDSLIEAKAKMDSEQSTQDYLLKERFRLRNAYLQGKATQQEAYDAQQEQIKHLDGALNSSQEFYYQKLAVLRNDLRAKYQITDSKDLIFFVAKQWKSAK